MRFRVRRATYTKRLNQLKVNQLGVTKMQPRRDVSRLQDGSERALRYIRSIESVEKAESYLLAESA